MDISWVVKYIVPIAAVVISAATFLFSFVWSYRREHARRLEIIDFATKRIDFWNQSLATVDLATDEYSWERQAVQAKALQAIQRIHAEAEQQMKDLVRSTKIDRAITWRSFKPETEKLQGRLHVFQWWCYAVFIAIVWLFTIFLFLNLECQVWHGRDYTRLELFLQLAIIIGAIFLGRYCLYKAEELKYDKPQRPVIDVI